MVAIHVKNTVIAPGNTLYCVFLGGGEQGRRSGESTRFPPVWPEFHSRTRSHMWVEFVVGSCPCSKRFSPGTLVLPSPH